MPSTIWTGTISFGLVAVPVRMVSATRDLDVRFHQVDARTGERIANRRVAEADGSEVSWDEIGRGYELEEQMVVLLDDELEAAAPERTHMIEIEEFVDADAIDPAQFNQPYFLLPGSDAQGVTHAYRLLRDAMAASDRIAIGRVVLRSNEYLVAVHERDELISLTTMLYADEIRQASEVEAIPRAEDWEPKPGEVDAAVELIEAMSKHFDPADYEDRDRQRLLELIQSKSRHKPAEAQAEAAASDEPAPAPDLMAALRESLARARGE